MFITSRTRFFPSCIITAASYYRLIDISWSALCIAVSTQLILASSMSVGELKGILQIEGKVAHSPFSHLSDYSTHVL